MELSNIAKSETPSKLLTPWWDVGIYYATGAMLILSVVAIGLQTTKDGLVCLPTVDCGAAFERSQSVACSKLKLPGKERLSGTVVLTTMKDRRQYDYVDRKCYAQIPTFPLYFSLFFFGETLLLLFISNFWLKYTKTSCTLNHFENLLSEFNHFELQACEHVASNDPELGNTDELKTKVNTFAHKVYYFKVQYDGTEYSHNSVCSLTFQYRLRFVAGMISLVTMLCSNTTFYSQSSIFSQCRLAKALFLGEHEIEHFECTRPFESYYSVMLYSFSGLVAVNILFFIRAGYWAFKELRWKPECEFEIEIFERPETASGDLAFLLKLLENSSPSFKSMIAVGIRLIAASHQRELENSSGQLGGANNDNVSWESSV